MANNPDGTLSKPAPGRPLLMALPVGGRSLLTRRGLWIPVIGTVLLLFCAGAAPAWVAISDTPKVERFQGIYLQQAVEVATVGDRMVIENRYTRFKKCGGTRGLAEEYNDHTVEILGRDTLGVGFVAGVVNLIDGCRPSSAPVERPAGGG
jgi:hypothetical protein